MANETGDFELTLDELRGVARYAAESAQEVLPLFEDANPEDPRPRDAVEAAWTFANGAARRNLQRLTGLDAHRAAKDATTDAARFAGRAAADAAELIAGDAPAAGDAVIERARRRATPLLIDVLGRYPLAPTGACGRGTRRPWLKTERFLNSVPAAASAGEIR
ncbi:putative immunity protein [Paenarthrobacter sp. PH39-S1]|uniref:putative immunity protein n=1 Tax=Paenarthrobacter sp. PH39-S1 TaxID=3046204 RepID=UPI0024BAC9EB|nr:hypothetical protein [Paenarthrobacter sp. PH39-S1]MDJ0357924.1 hypothetical protein [Paenarthrobacter sp. PH39-S1]